MSKTLEELKEVVETYANVISAPARYLPTYGKTEDGARAHLEVSGGKYLYLVVERGEIILRKETFDLDELMYWIFEHVASSMGGDSAATTIASNPNLEFRQKMFDEQLRILSKLSTKWAERRKLEQDEIIRRAP